MTQAQALLYADETDVFGDAGYQGVEKREQNLELPITWHVAMRPSQRRVLPKTTEGEGVSESLFDTPRPAFVPRLSIRFMRSRTCSVTARHAIEGWRRIPPSCSRCLASLIWCLRDGGLMRIAKFRPKNGK